MMVVVDTSIWSLAFRRSNKVQDDRVAELAELIREGRVVMLGAIRQELLSGVKSQKQFRLLRDKLRAFPDLLLTEKDYELAAECFNKCRSKGVQGSNTDFLLCSVGLLRGFSVFTSDVDFERFVKILKLRLHRVR